MGLRQAMTRYAIFMLMLMNGTGAFAQEPTDKQSLREKEVVGLIDSLQETAAGGIGYSSFAAGIEFAPLGIAELRVVTFGQPPVKGSPALRQLVALGTPAIPYLVAHLNDTRETKIKFKAPGRGGVLRLGDEYDFNPRTVLREPAQVNSQVDLKSGRLKNCTATVGDLCFVALGQIVNRSFFAIRYQPSSIVIVNSPGRSERLLQAIKKDWGNLNAQGHKTSLIGDITHPDSQDRRIGACLRLGYYFPEAIDSVAMAELDKPRYDSISIESFVREKLYPAESSQIQKSLIDAFLKKEGDAAKDGIILQLFEDLDRPGYNARACLIRHFGYPNDVKAQDRPYVRAMDNFGQARFIQALAYCPTAKIDDAVRVVLHSTEDIELACACGAYLAGRGADREIRRYLEKRLANANDERQKELRRLQERIGWTRLHVAAEEQQVYRMEKLIKEGAGVNAQAANGQTPLHVAASRGQVGAVRTLIDRKAELNIKDHLGMTPVQLAIRGEHFQVVSMLLTSGAEVTDILVAAYSGRADLVKRFVERAQVVVAQKTDEGDTPLHLAARNGHDKVAEILIASGAEVDAKSGSPGFTPLHYAAGHGHSKLVQLLLANGANPSCKTGGGSTALDFARRSKDAATIRLLEKK